MNDDDLRAAFEADAGLEAASPADPSPEVLEEIRTRVGVRRRARFAGLAVVVSFVLIGAAVLTAGLRGTDEPSSLVVADDGSSNAGTTPGTAGDGRDEPVKVLLTGDSFGYTLGYGFEGNPDTRQVSVWNQAVLYCGVVPLARPGLREEACEPWSEGESTEAVELFEPDLVVHALGPMDVVDAVAEDGSAIPVDSDDYGARFVNALVAQAAAAKEVGAPLVILTAPPWELDPSVNGDPAEPRPEWTRAEVERVHRVNDLARQTAAQAAPGMISIIELGDWLCPGDGVCRTAREGGAMRSDGLHFDDRSSGAREAAAWLAPQLVQLAGGAVTTGTSAAVPTTWNGSSGDAGTLEPYGPEPTNLNDAEVADPCAQVTTIPSCTQPLPTPTVTTPITPAPSVTLPHTPIDCGTDIPISGWPTTLITLQEGVNCLLAAFDAGNPARYRVVHFADDGADQEHVERWTLTVTGVHRVHVTVETKDYGAPESTYVLTATMPECRSLSSVHPDQRMVIVGDCS